MKLSLSMDELQNYITLQLEYRFPDKRSCLDFKESHNKNAFKEALERTEYCFKHITVRGYNVMDNGIEQPFFNHLHSDQYSQFLYYFSNSLWKGEGDTDLCSKLILLNRDLNGCWFSYKGSLPDIFLLVHPVGSVIGHINVKYSDFLVVMQNVTINGSYVPLELGEYLFLGAGAKIVGGGYIGNRVSIGANTLVRNPNIPDDSLVYRDVQTGAVVQVCNKEEICFAHRNYFKK